MKSGSGSGRVRVLIDGFFCSEHALVVLIRQTVFIRQGIIFCLSFHMKASLQSGAKKHATFSFAVLGPFNNPKPNILYINSIRMDVIFIIRRPIDFKSINKLFIANSKRCSKIECHKKRTKSALKLHVF